MAKKKPRKASARRLSHQEKSPCEPTPPESQDAIPDKGETPAASRKTDPEETHLRAPIKEVMVAHAGPLPAPDILAKYEKVLPGLAERIVRLTEQEQKHRHRQEQEELAIMREQVFSEARRLMIGQIGGLCFAGALIAAGVWFGHHRNFMAMGIVLVPTLFEAVSHLLLPRRRRRPSDRAD